MSYNHGPMLSEVFFGEFLRPYYDQNVPVIHRHGSKALVDTDGDVTTMIPWLPAAGLDGVYLPGLGCIRSEGSDVTCFQFARPGMYSIRRKRRYVLPIWF